MNPTDEEEKLNAVGECFKMDSQKLLKLWQEMYVLSETHGGRDVSPS